MNDRETVNSRRWERGPVRRHISLLLVLIGGLALGVFLHDPILHWLGRHEHSADRRAGTQASTKRQLWTCGMHPQVIQDKPGLCPICHMKLTPLEVGGDATGPAAARGGGKRKVKYWWDPMIGPESISDKPGKSSMGMDLVPVYEGEDSPSGGTAVTIDPVVVQNMGVRVVEVESGPVLRTVRAVGYLDEAQPNIRDVNLRVSGWVEKLYADTVGLHLRKGDKLFELYSPEVQVAVGELIAARKAASALAANADELSRRTAETLQDSSRRKLELWGLDEQEVERLATAEKAPRTVTFNSPITGHVTEKPIVQGSAVKAGDRAMRIVDHSTLWLDSQVYEQDLPFIKLGQEVTAAVEGAPGKEFEGKVIFIHPHVDPTTRTATVRITIPNPALRLRPGMYATAQIRAELAESALLVPREAVIDTGTRQVVFVVAGSGRFEPRNVKTGVPSTGGMIEILDGLKNGEQVVTSGQFLLDAESRMREAIQKHLNDRLLANQGETDEAPAGRPEAGEMRSDPSAQGDSAGQAASTAAEKLSWSPDVDAVFAQYLEMAKVLGAEEPPEAPLDVNELVAAAQALVDVTPPDQQAHARSVLTAASAFKGKPIDEQRKLFAALSEAVVAMAEVCPPSKALAEKLYVMFCPMKNARWLQTTEEVANPYYAVEMKRCGEVQRTIDAVAVE
jgi:RND family efflux transporter MFP subunit